MMISHSMLVQLGTLADGIALNSYQLRLLGIGWPPKRGWVTDLIGKDISPELLHLLQELRGPMDKNQRKEILARHGISAREMFQQRLPL